MVWPFHKAVWPFRKKFRVECTLFGADFVGSLTELAEFFTHHQVIPRIGDAVFLPRTVSAARSKPAQEEEVGAYQKPSGEWSTQETVTVDITGHGNVTSVFYSPGLGTVNVGVWLNDTKYLA